MDIYFSTLDRKKVMRIPILPENLPDITFPNKNEEFEGMKGTINLIGTKGLFAFNLQSIFPCHAYTFAKTAINGWQYVSFFKANKILRLTIINGKTKIINDVVTIEGFNYSVDKIGDIEYSIDVKQFKNF